ncbi:hypothetical protein BV20DRAFT_945438, partial [Pilatotrama ljubarskyi]
PWCHAGCPVIETMHHLFVHCPSFDGLRQSALRDLVVLRITSALFSDSVEVWPQYTSRYYLGTMPPIHLGHGPRPPAIRRLLTRVFHGWHSASIRLAGRIWGVYKRRTSPRTSAVPSTEALSLPPHLQYLLQ